jgi:hypothetical protein
MGDRISIQFKNKDELSVVLFSHWDGINLLCEVNKYIKTLSKGKETHPLDRKEPNTVMVDFIRYLTKDLERVDSNYYLGKDESDGDNSDNGHHIIKL